jgi:hypothetical protein
MISHLVENRQKTEARCTKVFYPVIFDVKSSLFPNEFFGKATNMHLFRFVQLALTFTGFRFLE